MKKWILGIIICSLFLSLTIPVYGQEAKAYATVLIIVPPREKVEEVKQTEQKQAMKLEKERVETSSQEKYEYYEIIEASSQKD